MLTRIEIDGFKTFKDFALDVPPFLVVLGRNASGKSNLLDAIAFLARLAGGATVMQAVRGDRSRFHELLHRDSVGQFVDTMRFAVELGDVPSHVETASEDAEIKDLRYELTVRVHSEDPAEPVATRSLVVDDERWFVAVRRPDGVRAAWSPLEYHPSGEATDAEPAAHRYPASHAFRPAVRRSTEGVVLVAAVNHLVQLGRREMASWRVLGLEPSSLRASDTYEDDDRLSPSGAHLPNTLARIVRRTRSDDSLPGALSDIAGQLATLVPEVLDVRVEDVASLRTRQVVVSVKGEGEIGAQAASDGTLRALALITAISDPEDTGLLCVEEPENGVYPQRLRRLVQLLRGEVGTFPRRQVLVTSHSPEVLGVLPDPVGRPLRDDVVFFAVASRASRSGGTARVSRIRRLRGDQSVPLPPDLSGPIMSRSEIEAFAGCRPGSGF